MTAGGSRTMLLAATMAQEGGGYEATGVEWDVATPENFSAITGTDIVSGDGYVEMDMWELFEATAATDTVTANFTGLVQGAYLGVEEFNNAGSACTDATHQEQAGSPIAITVPNVENGDAVFWLYQVGEAATAPAFRYDMNVRQSIDDVGDGYSGCWMGDRFNPGGLYEARGYLWCENGTPTYGHHLLGVRVPDNTAPDVRQVGFRGFAAGDEIPHYDGAIAGPGSFVIADSGSNTLDTTYAVAYPAYVSGDLLIQFVCGDDDEATDSLTAPANGPNSEAFEFAAVIGDSGGAGGPAVGLVAWVGTGTEIAGTMNWTRGAGEQWIARTIKIPAGSFDSADPINAVSSVGGYSTAQPNARSAAVTSTSACENGLAIAFLGIDLTTVDEGWEANGWDYMQLPEDIGEVGIGVAAKSALVGASETVSAADFDLVGANDESSSITVIVGGVAGTHDGRTAAAALNTNWSQDVDTDFGVQFHIENFAGAGPTAYRLEYNHNAGGWNAVTTTSSVVRLFATSDFVNGADVVAYLAGDISPDNYLANNNAALETANTFSLGEALPYDEEFEGHFNVQIRSADVADSDTIQLRIAESDGTALDSYTQTPTITVIEGQIIAPTGVAGAESFGTAQINMQIVPTGKAGEEAFGTTTVKGEDQTVIPTGVATGESAGSPQINLIVLPSGKAGEEAFGTLTIVPGAVLILPTGKAGEESFGTATLPFDATIFPTMKASDEAFGAASVQGPDQDIFPTATTPIEMLTNGDLATGDDTGWTLEASWSVVANALYYNAPAVSHYAAQTLDIEASTSYMVAFTISGYVTGLCTPIIGGSVGTSRAANGRYYEVVTTGASPSDSLARFTGSNPGEFTIDDCSVVKMGGIASGFSAGTTLIGVDQFLVIEQYGPEMVVDGDMSVEASWTHTPDPDWSWVGEQATYTGASSGTLAQTPAAPLDIRGSTQYEVTFTVSGYVGGSIQPFVGSTGGTSRSANGTYTEIITTVASPGSALQWILSAGAEMTVDDVSVRAISGIASLEEFTSTAEIEGDAQTILPTGYPGDEAFGSPTVSEGVVTLRPGGIASGFSAGTTLIVGGAEAITQLDGAIAVNPALSGRVLSREELSGVIAASPALTARAKAGEALGGIIIAAPTLFGKTNTNPVD
jgi:hypothetical protein